MKKQRFFIIVAIIAILVLIIIIGEILLMRNIQRQQQTPTSPSLTTQAWLFPSNKTCDATQDIINNNISTIKAQYYNLGDNGTLQLLTGECNAYTSDNVALIKKHSSQQYVTVSGHVTGMAALVSNKALINTFTNTMLSFLQNTGFNGVELDFEDYADWTAPQYANYKAFLISLGNTLHAQGYKLMLDGPAISDTTYQSYYPLWKWSDFDVKQNPSLANAIDYLVVLAYDYDADQGAGTPVAPLSWINGICQWMLNNISDHNKIVIGINSYGYHAPIGSYKNIVEDTHQQSTQFPGFNTATRNASSGEMTWTNAGIFYDFSDQTTLQGKLNVVLQNGIQAASIWHLGGNLWLPNTQPTPTPTTDTLTLTSGQIKDIYDALTNALTQDQIATIKNIITG